MGLIRKEDIHESLLNSLSNPNLLINGDFQVWQRGTSFNGANIYTADRWKTNFNATVTKKNGKAHVYANELFGGLIQFIEFEGIKNSIQGRDISGTIKLNIISGYVTFVVQFIPKSSAPTITKSITVNNGVNSLTLTTPDNLDDYRTFECLVYGNPNTEYEIEYMKVELGSFATPFVPRPYSQELALCKRYYQYGAYRGVGSLYTASGYLYVPLDVNLRITPTLGTKSVAGVLRTANGHADVKTISSAGLCNNGIMLGYTHEISSPVTNTPVFWDNGRLELDAEIY